LVVAVVVVVLVVVTGLVWFEFSEKRKSHKTFDFKRSLVK